MKPGEEKPGSFQCARFPRGLPQHELLSKPHFPMSLYNRYAPPSGIHPTMTKSPFEGTLSPIADT